MKIRQGFVSNSSSSSFCLLCIQCNDEKYKIDVDDRYNEIDSTELSEAYAIDEYDEAQYLGMTPHMMKDDETLLQFKQRIVDELKKLNVEVDVSDLFWEVQGGYNG